ncbi:hypothetical protein KP509_05G057900 [Ceratopteris richardii]|uniref:HMG box domain-containing protein n=1 Tax=Ceratopteris richardii TaxID=49495 RepID=A0A8T2UU67_CERRI|nr:hypothetical protein KP509_05G057900 [Ceratopteris richardii]
MASSAITCKSQPPKVRKRIAIGVLAAGVADAKQNPPSGIQSHDCAIGNIDSRENTNDSTKISEKNAEPPLSNKDVAIASNVDNMTGTKMPRKRRGTGTGEVVILASNTRTKVKRAKNPNEPKRPPTAFLLFMEEFRQAYKKANPNGKGGASLITKEGSEKWRAMSVKDKEPFVKMSAEKKEDYQKAFKIYRSGRKDSVESTITDNAEAKHEEVDESSEETAGSAQQQTDETEQ